MTSVEIAEQLKIKKAALETYRASTPNANAEVVKTLEEEIKQLESSLTNNPTAPKKRRMAFLDECAG
jgi:hypothetical protein